MDIKPLFEVSTSMEKDDYKKYLYFTTFRKSKKTLPSFLFLALVGTFLFCMILPNKTFSYISSVFLIICLLFLSLLFLKLDRQVKALYPRDKAPILQKTQLLTFFEDYMTASNRMSEGFTEKRYEELHEIYETAEYLILYLDDTTATLLRKKDIPSEQLQALLLFLKERLAKRYQTLL